jgi:hypothetical protein
MLGWVRLGWVMYQILINWLISFLFICVYISFICLVIDTYYVFICLIIIQ